MERDTVGPLRHLWMRWPGVVAALLIAGSGLVSGTSAALGTVPNYLVIAWATLMIGGSMMSIIGLALANGKMQRAAATPTICGLLVYVTVLLANSGDKGTAAALLIGALMLFELDRSRNLKSIDVSLARFLKKPGNE